MKDHQFTTDAYKLFSVLTRMVNAPESWYNSSSTQKFVLCQIKAMDYSLADEGSRQRNFADRASYSAVDEIGALVINDDLDISLLTMYGYILYAGTNYQHSLSKSWPLSRRKDNHLILMS